MSKLSKEIEALRRISDYDRIPGEEACGGPVVGQRLGLCAYCGNVTELDPYGDTVKHEYRGRVCPGSARFPFTSSQVCDHCLKEVYVNVFDNKFFLHCTSRGGRCPGSGVVCEVDVD